MPNYCENKLTVTGSEQTIAKMKKKVSTKKCGLVFEKILPCPAVLIKSESPFRGTEEESKLLIKKYGFDNWYDWCVSNWGTKWSIDYQDNPAQWCGNEITFDTAWSPPEGIIMQLSKMFPTLTFLLEYDEPGMAFKGEFTYKAGENEFSQYEEAISNSRKQITIRCKR